MDDSAPEPPALAGGVKRFSRRLLALGSNRLALLEIELHEARDEALKALILVLGGIAFAFLSVSTLTAAIVVALWQTSPAGVLLGLAALYGAASFLVFRGLAARNREWKLLAGTTAELVKDRQSLEKLLS